MVILIGVELSVVVLSLCILVPVLIICFWIAVAAFVAIFVGIKVLHVVADFGGPSNASQSETVAPSRKG